jgi:hypothetical protein
MLPVQSGYKFTHPSRVALQEVPSGYKRCLPAKLSQVPATVFCHACRSAGRAFMHCIIDMHADATSSVHEQVRTPSATL